MLPSLRCVLCAEPFLEDAVAQPAIADDQRPAPSLSITVRTMQAPARITSARLG